MADDERWKPMAFVKHGAAGGLVHGGITSRPELLDNAIIRGLTSKTLEKSL